MTLQHFARVRVLNETAVTKHLTIFFYLCKYRRDSFALALYCISRDAFFVAGAHTSRGYRVHFHKTKPTPTEATIVE